MHTTCRSLLVLSSVLLLAACAQLPGWPADKTSSTTGSSAVPPRPARTPRIALALGGGAARGFAHVGVIKVLEAQGIKPDIVVGTSAGAVVGALYAAGFNGYELQKFALQMDENQISDWSLPARGVIKGEALQDFVNHAVGGRPLEKLARNFSVVATNLRTGEAAVFRTGNTGMAVRASSSVPGVFQPVVINKQEYVDGGLVHPVPVNAARNLGADFVIAVDISAKPQYGRIDSTLDILLQTFTIMGLSISRHELANADVVIRPDTPNIKATSFQDRHLAVLEGEKAATTILPALRSGLEKWAAEH